MSSNLAARLPPSCLATWAGNGRHGGGVWNVHIAAPLAACPGHAPWREGSDCTPPNRGLPFPTVIRTPAPACCSCQQHGASHRLSAKPWNVAGGCMAALPVTGATEHGVSLSHGWMGCSLPRATHGPAQRPELGGCAHPGRDSHEWAPVSKDVGELETGPCSLRPGLWASRGTGKGFRLPKTLMNGGLRQRRVGPG